jgi:ribosome-associated translation inhibitor RaiA
MQINIQALGFALTATLLDHIERRLRFALTRTSGRIKKVVIRLGETNVSRRGEDKFCRIQVYFDEAALVLIEDTGPDLYAVINRVAERAGRNVANYVERRHENVRLARLKPLRSLPGSVFAMSKM